MRKSLYLLIISFLWACGGQEQATDTTKATTDSLNTVETTKEETLDLDKNWHTQYVGTINGNIPIHLSITKVGENLRGSYYYDRHGIPLNLIEGKLAKDGSFTFNEYGVLDKTGSIAAFIKGDKIQGFWYNKDESKKLVLDLVRDTSTNQMLFDVFYESKRVPLEEGDTTAPMHTFIQTVLYPSIKYGGAKKEEIYQLFNEIFKGNLVNGNPYETIANMHEEAVESYRKTNSEIYQEDPSYGSSMDWSEVAHMGTVYNDQDVLSLRQQWYNFTGGAHGNYGANYFVMDLKAGKRILLEDVVQKKYYLDIAAIIRQKIWEQRGLKAGETLQEIGFDTEGIVPTENFFLTHAGIGFYYSPYEIGPYALGSIEIFIPFKECQRFLTANYQKLN